jgi:hypothetical protein
MKAKRILIAYLQSNDIKSIVSREYIYNKVRNDLMAEGRVIKTSIPSTMTTFEDGSKVYLYPIALNLKGMKITHAFVDESILKLENHKEIINEAIVPTLMQGTYIKDFEISEPWNERILLYKYNYGDLTIKPFYNEKN